MQKKTYKPFLLLVVLLTLALLSGCASSGNPDPGNHSSNPPADVSSPQQEPPSQSGQEDKDRLLLNRMMDLAKQGQVINCPFAARDNVLEDVEEKWGKPEQLDYVPAAKGQFATYPDHNVVLGINKGSQIFEVRSYDPALKSLTLSRVKEILGTPDLNRDYQGETIIGYRAGDDFKLRLVFPQPNQDQPDPHLSHVGVLYPRGTVNQMADDPGVEW